MPAREHATDLAKADTWGGWIARARQPRRHRAGRVGPLENRAALARARALIAYEFSDGLAEAKAAVDAPRRADRRSTAMLAAAYLALAQNDAKAAHAAADEALALAPSDAAALYVSRRGRGARRAISRRGITTLRGAVDREPRPLYYLGLARAQAQRGAVGRRARDARPRAQADARSSRVAPRCAAYVLAASGQLPAGKDGHRGPRGSSRRSSPKAAGRSPSSRMASRPRRSQLGNLALARVDFVLGNGEGARPTGSRPRGRRRRSARSPRRSIETLLRDRPSSTSRTTRPTARSRAGRRAGVARTTLAQICIALGKPTDALESAREVGRRADLAQDARGPRPGQGSDR